MYRFTKSDSVKICHCSLLLLSVDGRHRFKAKHDAELTKEHIIAWNCTIARRTTEKKNKYHFHVCDMRFENRKKLLHENHYY